MPKRSAGFTMIEMLIVLSIVCIVVCIILIYTVDGAFIGPW